MTSTTDATDAQLTKTADLLKRAKKLVFKEPDTAVELLQQALLIHEKLGLSDDPKSADFYLNYGLALVGKGTCLGDSKSEGGYMGSHEEENLGRARVLES